MKSFFKNCRLYFREYCTFTSVHGFQYFGEKKRHLFERIWWIVIFLICLSACTFSVYAVYKKWEESPVIVNFANKGTPIYEIPFPAVTICPESKVNQQEFNFTEVLLKLENQENLTQIEKTQLEYFSLLCKHKPKENVTYNFTYNDDFFEVLHSAKPKFQILNCTIMGMTTDCRILFRPILTDEGVCYNFNMLDRSQIFCDSVIHFQNYHSLDDGIINSTSWTLEDGYFPDSGIDVYPLRAFLAGAPNGLSFNILTPKADLDYACRQPLDGYKILLHTPMTIPRPNLRYFRVPLDRKVIAAVQPNMITTSKRVRNYDPEKRNCYFSEEKKLKYFLNYSTSNCNLECLTNSTLDLCDCVDFYMPRENGTKICGVGSVDCIIIAIKMAYYFHLSDKLGNQRRNLDYCHCLPICTDLTYEVETSQTDFKWEKMLKVKGNLPRRSNTSHLTSVSIFFKFDHFITSERNELYGPLDFLANFGGILGLFTGFSILSLMEIIYFLTIRICCNFRLFGNWAGQDQS